MPDNPQNPPPPILDSAALTAELKKQAAALGFVLSGVAPAISPLGVSRFHDWLAAGFAGEMRFLTDRAAAYEHPRSVLAGVRSVLMLALPYRTQEPRHAESGEGKVSRYAWGETDYHDLIHERLHALADWLKGSSPGASVRGVVDTAPLLEREFAQLAGLGWIGKNTLLLNKRHGSWFFLAALLTDLELLVDAPLETDHCGTCTACLQACPTQAFPAPYVLDASRCISYLTIELRGPMPLELREGVGDWLFGCDVCQEVCPWNHKAPTTAEPMFQPLAAANPLELAALFSLGDEAFRERFRRTPLWRSKRRGILRNAAIVLGNQKAVGGLAALLLGLHDIEPLVRGASAWAIGKIGNEAAREALGKRLEIETDEQVRGELALALRL